MRMDNFREMNITGLGRWDFLSARFQSRDGTGQIIDRGREQTLPKERSCEETITMNQSVKNRQQIDELVVHIGLQIRIYSGVFQELI
jgi:hypothetical protein